MSGKVGHVKVLRISRDRREDLRDTVAKERPVTIFLNDFDLATLMCTPKGLEYLAVGFLFAEGLVKGREDIEGVLTDARDGVVWVRTREVGRAPENLASKRVFTTGCGRGLTFVDAVRDRTGLKATSRFTMPATSVSTLMTQFQRGSELFRLTGGVHAAALCSAVEVLVFNEDIGRHSAIDKVVGECVMRGMRTDDKVLMTSGRISSEIMIKVARSHIPIVVSKSAPTDLAVKLAVELGIALVGFARGSRMNVYSNAWRLPARKTGGPRAVRARTR